MLSGCEGERNGVPGKYWSCTPPGGKRFCVNCKEGIKTLEAQGPKSPIMMRGYQIESRKDPRGRHWRLDGRDNKCYCLSDPWSAEFKTKLTHEQLNSVMAAGTAAIQLCVTRQVTDTPALPSSGNSTSSTVERGTMTTRLDRLLLLLSDGPNASVRLTAARQFGSLAAQRVGHGSTHGNWRGIDGEWAEVANLLGRLLPLLRAKSSETRTAASQAVEAICKAVGTWDPTSVKLEVDETAQPSALDSLDVNSLLSEGAPLLAAAIAVIVPPTPVATNGHANADDSKLSAREKVALKRKRKAEEKQGGRAAKVQATEAHRAAPILPEASTSNEPVVIAYKKPEGGEIKPAAAPLVDWSVSPEQWPFSKIADQLVASLMDEAWEIRHGAALGLRELLRHQAIGAGGLSPTSRSQWTDAVSIRFLKLFVRDRFGDFVGDHVVAPVRETAAQALAALLKPAPAPTVQRVASALIALIRQKGAKQYAWQVRHAGLLALQYLVAARPDALHVNTAEASCRIEDVVEVALLGLKDADDDVRGAAAATLLPLVDRLVVALPAQTDAVINALWHCLSDLGDDLASSVAVVMSLLSRIMSNETIIERIQSGKGGDINERIPLLYPFFRHTIAAVRLAVVDVLLIFLRLPSSHLSWLSAVPLRLIFQNIVLEERPAIREASTQVWLLACSVMSSEQMHQHASSVVDSWLAIVSTPIGTALDPSLFYRPPVAAAAHNVDKPTMQQDMRIVSASEIMAGRLAGVSALAFLLSRWPIERNEGQPFTSALASAHIGASMLQRFVAAAVIAEWAGRLTQPVTHTFFTSSAFTLLAILEGEPPSSYTETSGQATSLATDCQRLAAAYSTTTEVISPTSPSLEAVERLRGPLYTIALTAVKKQPKKAAALEEKRRRVDASLTAFKAAKERADVQLYAVVAEAVIALQATPSKLNPLIRSLMNSVKTEENEQLQRRAASSLAVFIHRCAESAVEGRPNPADKVVKNLCVFLCQDPSSTPLFADRKISIEEIITLQDQQPQTAPTAANEGDAPTASARITRRGCEAALAALATTFGDVLLDQLPKLREAIFDPLLAVYTASDSKAVNDQRLEAQDDQGQAVIDALTILGVLVAQLRPAARIALAPILPSLSQALRSHFSVIRNAAALCWTAMCDAAPVEYLRHVVVDILPFAADTTNVVNRKGVIELVAQLVARLDIRILPYIIFFVVPVLGRMTDSDEAVRLLATNTFASVVQLVPLEAGLPDPEGFPADLVAKRDEERAFLSQLLDGNRVEEYKLPMEVKAELRKYQREGISWMAFLAKFQLHGILCDDMGLGKTLQSICILASKHYERAERYRATSSPDSAHTPSLVVCPPTLTGHWAHEIRTYVSNLRPLLYVGDVAARATLRRQFGQHDVVITSYDVIRNDIAHLEKMQWLYCILDEGHIIKNGKSKLTQAVKTLRSHHRIILSGTPIQNNVLELWSLFDFLMPGFLGSERAFNDRYGKPVQASRDAKSSSKQQSAGALALEALHKQVLPFLLRRLKEDVLDDLPPKIIQDYYCDLSPMQRELYERHGESSGIKQEVGSEGDAEKAGQHIFQSLQYLRQLVNHPRLVLRSDDPTHAAMLKRLEATKAGDLSESPKLQALRQILLDCGIGASTADTNALDDGAAAPHRVLIFCQVRQMLDLVEYELLRGNMPSVTYMRMDGSTPPTERHGVVQAFNADPSIDVLLLTTHVGGLGLNLTGADTVIFVEHDWNPMKDLQAMDRAHRLGQKRVVNVYRLIMRDTLEEKIMGLQRFKLNIASSVVTQQNASLSTMGTDQVLDLFQLSSTEPAAKEPKDQPMSQRAMLDSLGALADRDGDDDALSFAATLV